MAIRTDLATLEVSEGTLPIFAEALNRRGELMRARTTGLGGFRTSVGTFGARFSQAVQEQLAGAEFILVPNEFKRPFETASSLAYGAIKRAHGMDYSIIAGIVGANVYRYVKIENVPVVVADVEKASETLDEGVKALLANAERIGRQNRALLEEIANEIIAGYARADEDLPQNLTEEGYRERFLDRAMARYEMLIGSVRGARIILEARKIPLGSEVFAQQAVEAKARAEKEEAERAEELAKQETALELMRQAQMSEQIIEAQRKEWQRDQEIKNQLANLEVETKRRVIEEAMNPIRENLMRIRAKVNQDIASVLDDFERKRRDGKPVELSPQTAKMLKGITTFYQEAKLADDGELEKLLRELNVAAIPSTRLRPVDPGQVIDTMERLVSLTEEAANEALASGREDLLDF